MVLSFSNSVDLMIGAPQGSHLHQWTCLFSWYAFLFSVDMHSASGDNLSQIIVDFSKKVNSILRLG